jgi:hypothetical protein
VSSGFLGGGKVLTGIELIAAERKRQVEEEGYTAEHDDQWERGDTMKVRSVVWEEPEMGIMILIDGKKAFDVFEDEPEDMKFYRTLQDCLKVPDLLRLAYEAGKNGEGFELERINTGDENA